MRRRPRAGRDLTAEQLTELYADLQVAHAGASSEVRRYAVRAALAEHGYTPLDAIRARYWLRRGKPAGYLWAQPDVPQRPAYLLGDGDESPGPGGRPSSDARRSSGTGEDPPSRFSTRNP